MCVGESLVNSWQRAGTFHFEGSLEGFSRGLCSIDSGLEVLEVYGWGRLELWPSHN
jgi:hypothetical protein